MFHKFAIHELITAFSDLIEPFFLLFAGFWSNFLLIIFTGVRFFVESQLVRVTSDVGHTGGRLDLKISISLVCFLIRVNRLEDIFVWAVEFFAGVRFFFDSEAIWTSDEVDAF